MDWFDAYLDNLSDGKNVVYPPDSHTWRPIKPTRQQQSLIQDSLIGDMVRMRLIQEARQAEVEAGMGGGYDAGSAAVEGPVATPVPVVDMRSLLSAPGKTAYDAAATNNFFSVSKADYDAVAAGLQDVTKYALDDSTVAQNGETWAASYAQAFPTSVGTVPAGVYLFGFISRTTNGGSSTPLISTTFKGTYTAIANTVNSATGGSRGYYLRKASTATAAISYLGLVNTSESYLTTTSTFGDGGFDDTVPYSTWTNWNGRLIIFQMLGAPTKQWD